MGKRAAIYLRVSTDEQTTENQERALREVAARSGHEIVAVYRDEGISGAKGRDKRPGFDAMHKDASRRKFDIVMAWSVDRLGRSLQDLIGFLSELHSLGIDLALHQQGIDATTPAGKAMFQMMGVFAEFERSMVVERVRAGVARAKASGTKSAKPSAALVQPPRWNSESATLWRLLDAPASIRSPLNLAWLLARFNGLRTGEDPSKTQADMARSHARWTPPRSGLQ
jgi:DNA invertase Pin-like site-specific DNA recombinase